VRSNLGKIGVICLVLMLCLAAIGVGYGHWSQTLNIDGTVDTGELDIEFLNCVTGDNETGGDVGEMSVLEVDTDGDLDIDKLIVTLDYGYFCYEGYVIFDVHNNGSVPEEVVAVTITEPIGGEVDVSLSGIAVGSQLSPGQSVPCVLSAHVTSNVSGTYSFSVVIEAWNWNQAGG